MTETYTYGANGLPSKRETAIRRGSTEIQKFTQDFSYDEFLALDGVDYPTCSSCSMTGALTSVDHTRTRGLLTRVNGFASISYHPSGMVNEVKRETARVMTDTYEADSGMARPSKITFSGALACTVPSPPEIAVAAFVCGGAAGNQASVSGPQQSGVTYEWTIQNGTLATATGTSVSFTAGSSGQVTLTVTARNDCGTATSIPKTARIPEAIVSGGKTVNAGSPAGISVALTGTPNWRLTWSDNNFVSSGIAVSQFERTVTPNVTTTYQLVAATDGTPCNLVRSGSATITVIPPAPGGIVAEATDRSVEVDWQAVPSIPGAKYEVERASKLNGPWTRVGSVTAQLSLTDTPPADPAGARIAYVYRVRTVAPDGTRSAESASPRDYAVTATSMYPSGAITARATFVKVQHVVELRRGIDALRKLVNLPETFVSQPDPAGWVVASHFTALLAPLDQARSAFGHGSFAYGGVPRPAAGVTIKAEHVTQLREVLK